MSSARFPAGTAGNAPALGLDALFDRSEKASTHFRWTEFAVSGAHPELVEPVPLDLRPSVRRLAATVLEVLRRELGQPITVLSGYRSPDLNRVVGGSPTSQHLRGEAADLHVDGLTALALFQHLMARVPLLPTGQVILYPDRGFVHVALPSRTYPTPTFCVHYPRRHLVYARVAGPSQLEALLAGGEG